MIVYPSTISLNGALDAGQLADNFNALQTYFNVGASGSVAAGLTTSDFATLNGSLRWTLLSGGQQAVVLNSSSALNSPLNLSATSQGDYLVHIEAAGGRALSVTASNPSMAEPAVRVIAEATGVQAGGVTVQHSGASSSTAFINTDGPVVLSGAPASYGPGAAWVESGTLRWAETGSNPWPGRADEATITKGPKLQLKDGGLTPKHIGNTYFSAAISTATNVAPSSSALATLNIINGSTTRKALVGLKPTATNLGTIVRTTSLAVKSEVSVTFEFENVDTLTTYNCVVTSRGEAGRNVDLPVAQIFAFIDLAAGSNTIKFKFTSGANQNFSNLEAYAILL